ncbi:MAG: pyridoxamine 5'-phosphate oxidase [Alphaproteobacteria bacterium]|nr:MAG: pyridoxamine 5'-phosphate oxidase [Alphaproteobacteria bacterium]
MITGTDPDTLFEAWFAEASAAELNDPNAMAVATATQEGVPSVRTCLLKGRDATGYVFYTNFTSRKGQELTANPVAALLFHWKSLRRQVRIEGPVEAVSDAEADAYFASRPYGSRIGAWASLQSQPLDRRETLEARVAELSQRYPESGPVPRPPHWSGWRVLPRRIEFWQDMPYRLHDRLVFTRASDGWETERLFP